MSFMIRTLFLCVGAVVALNAAAQEQDVKQPGSLHGSRPNIILILTDDMGYGELSCNGHPYLKTPNIDKLQQKAVRFTQFRVAPKCSPSRAGILTGMHNFYSEVVQTRPGRCEMTPIEPTLAEVLKGAGYKTAMAGKWHLGAARKNWPSARGFDDTLFIGGGSPGGHGDFLKNSFTNTKMLKNGEVVRTEGWCTKTFVNYLASWIDEQKNADQPFFAFFPNVNTHGNNSPIVHKQPFLDRGIPKAIAGYYGSVSYLDYQLGRLFDYLDASGLSENTLIIYTHDNGHGTGLKDTSKYFNAGLRGHKSSKYDGGIRMPCYFYWKGRVEGGRDIDKSAVLYDVLPTLASFAGAKLPADSKVDGRDLVPLIENPRAAWEEKYAVIGSNCVVGERFKLFKGTELYDYRQDPGETTNVVDQHPDVVKKMTAFHRQWEADVAPNRIRGERKPAPKPYPLEQLYEEAAGNKGDMALPLYKAALPEGLPPSLH